MKFLRVRFNTIRFVCLGWAGLLALYAAWPDSPSDVPGVAWFVYALVAIGLSVETAP